MIKFAERNYFIVEVEGVSMEFHGPYLPNTFQRHVDRAYKNFNWTGNSFLAILKYENKKLAHIPYNPEAKTCQDMVW